MAKRTLRAEPKKECPSCGLGVSPESTICEFCGWNFEEEDEWILQIEKLERDLMLEKQKYEPGTVDHMLESTLRSPLLERVESSVPCDEDAMRVEEAEPEYEEPAEEEIVQEEALEEQMAEEPAHEEPVAAQPVAPEPEMPKVRRVRSVKTSPAPAEEEVREPAPMPIRKVKAMPQRRVRSPEPEATERPSESEEDARPVRKTRTVRRVKRQ